MKSIISNRSSDTADLVGKVADEFLKAVELGQNPDVEEYAERYPEIGPILRDVLPALTLMNPALAGEDSPQPDSENLSIRVLGDFRIEREIGRGGMGVVYEAEQISLGRRVALKVLPFAGVLDERQLQRFKNEARAAATLEHPHIVPVYSVGCERGVHYFAMRFIDGQSLAEILQAIPAYEASQSEGRSEVGDRRSDARGRRSEVGGRKPESAAGNVAGTLRTCESLRSGANGVGSCAMGSGEFFCVEQASQ